MVVGDEVLWSGFWRWVGGWAGGDAVRWKFRWWSWGFQGFEVVGVVDVRYEEDGEDDAKDGELFGVVLWS